MQPLPNCPDFFSTILCVNSNRNILQPPSSLQRCTALINTSPEQSCLTTGKRQQLLFWNKLLCETWHLHSCFPRQSPMSPSEQDPLRKLALWAIICDPYLYHISCTVSHFSIVRASCVPLFKGMPKPVFWGVSGFSHGVYTHYPSCSFKQAHSHWLVSQNASDSTILG